MPAATLPQLIAQLAPYFTVTRPAGSGPFPVVIMLHGCGGPRPFIRDMAKVAVEAGAAAIVVDSFAHRNISRMGAYATVCTGARLQGRERAGDLFAAMTWTRVQAWADDRRIIAMGWSHGGWTIMDALALRRGGEMERATGLADLPHEPLSGLAGTIIVYPYASVGSLVGRRDWRLAPRSLAIVAGRDTIVGNSRPALERQRQRGAPLEILTFNNATHAFEDAEAQDLRVRYDAEATARERMLLREFIANL